MILCLLLCVALAAAPGVGAQEAGAAGAGSGEVLELPTVTLVGVDTLYLKAPPPTFAQRPSPIELPPLRRRVEEQALPALPAPPLPAAWLSRSTAAGGAPSGGSPEAGAGSDAAPRPGPLADASAARPGRWEQVPVSPGSASPSAWEALAYYVPGELLGSEVRAVSQRGAWESEGQLDLGLADGWIALAPAAPTYLWGSAEGRVEGRARFRVGVSAGAFLPEAAPPGGSALRYVLALSEDLQGSWGPLSLTHQTDLAGMSPGGAAGRVGLLGQRLSLEGILGSFALRGEAVGYLRGTLEPQAGQLESLVRLGAAYREPLGRVALSAGAAGLYGEEGLAVYPEAGLQLSFWRAFTLRVSAEAFLKGSGAAALPSPALVAGWPFPAESDSLLWTFPMGLLSEPSLFEEASSRLLGAQAVSPAGSLAVLRPQNGYALRGALLLAAGERLRARLGAELLSGSLYEGWGGALVYQEASRLGLLAQLSVWLLRFGTSGGGLEAAVRAQGAVPLPVTVPAAGLLASLDGERLEGELRLAFPNLPLRFIMGALWGEVPAGPTAAALLSPWEPFRGVAASLGGELELSRRRHVLRGGVEVRIPESEAVPELRFAAEYRYRGR